MKHVSLDIHDGSVLRTRMDLLLQYKEHYPDFKVSLFWIPFDAELEISQQRLLRGELLERIKENLDWIQLIPHGLTHMPQEFLRCDRATMQDTLATIDEAMTKDGLPYEKGFCAPYWLWNKDVVDVLDEAGWWGAVDRNQPGMLKTKRFYEYSHSIDEPFWTDDREITKLHGHMTGPSANALEANLASLLHIEPDAEWHFITDYLEEKA